MSSIYGSAAGANVIFGKNNTGVAFSPAVSAFTPNDVDDLIVWLKADAGITKNGSNYVSAWDDQTTGGSNNTAQATADSQPLWIDDTQNGLPILSFDGTDDFLQKTTWSAGAISQPITIFLVLKNLRASTNEEYFYDCGSGNRTALIKSAEDPAFYYPYAQGAGYTSDIDIDTDFHYLTILYNGASSTFRLDGGTETDSGTVGSVTMTGLTLAQRGDGVADRFSQCYIGEIMVYESDVSDSDRTLLETYLKDRWDL